MFQPNPALFPLHLTGSLTTRQRELLRLDDFKPLTSEERDEQKADVYFCYLETQDYLRELKPGKRVTDNQVFDFMIANQMADGEISRYSKVMLYAIVKRFKEQDERSLLK